MLPVRRVLLSARWGEVRDDDLRDRRVTGTCTTSLTPDGEQHLANLQVHGLRVVVLGVEAAEAIS